MQIMSKFYNPTILPWKVVLECKYSFESNIISSMLVAKRSLLKN